MSALWLFYVSLTVIGATIYNVAVKVSGDQINVFLFSVYLTMGALAAHLVMLLVYKYGFVDGKSLQVSPTGVTMALLAGAAVSIIDVGFFLAVKQGGMVSSQLVWTIGSTLLVTAIGILYFKEIISLQKLIGIGFGLISVWLIISAKS